MLSKAPTFEGYTLSWVKYLNNIVAQDHRFIKRLVKPGMGFFSLPRLFWQRRNAARYIVFIVRLVYLSRW
jgi:transposase-like protein